jgi:hypothetical protein
MARSKIYPHLAYHVDGSQKIVQTEAEREALGKDWADTRVDPPEPGPEADPLEERLAAIEARLDAIESKRKK